MSLRKALTLLVATAAAGTVAFVASTSSHAAATGRGGTLTFALPGGPPNLNPALNPSGGQLSYGRSADCFATHG